MTKLMLTKKNEISVTEEKKGKQIAVKENNIASLKQFFRTNFNVPVAPVTPSQPIPPTNPTSIDIPSVAPLESQDTINNVGPNPFTPPVTPVIETVANSNPIDTTPIINITTPETIPVTPPPIETPVVPTPTIENTPSINPAPLNNESIAPIVTPEPTNPIIQNQGESGDTSTATAQAIHLVPETIETEQLEEEMDPELKEIKARLDQVINDLNNYKKKIKILENEVNQNLEKSREVLKDTQAAAKIMAIQQERQRQITEEVNGSAPLNDPTRVLQKDVA